ncbi:Transmembrane protease serine 6 [Entomophthora muscae]|uniref:Transmembrane protease serine 6 n=1 Tax=Entomophthora muscae TaxID=34485 RepID=A0ACC2SXM7_9FUNG|nr:Transmembrane protease serine 6 [Entomophthora muscae]
MFMTIGLAVIVNNFDKYPWIGLVLYRGAVKCISVLFPTYAIAPASCLRNPSKAYSIKTEHYHVRVTHYAVHKKYSDANFANDLAILRFRGPIQLASSRSFYRMSGLIRSMKFPVFSVGWMKVNGTLNLVQNPVKAIGNPECQIAYPDTSSSQACARFLPSITRDCLNSCGAPIFQNVSGNILLAGITSWGPVCGKKSIPLIYTKSRQLSRSYYHSAGSEIQ